MIKHIPLNQSILQAAIAEIDRENCLLLFPTRKSRNEAIQLYQQNWDFSRQQFLTMDEWKESLFVSKLPILKEEKRTLALYQSLHEENKDFFKIRSYHQFIDFANKLFNFWEELLEEQIKPEKVVEIIAAKQTAGSWQLNMFEQLQELKLNYEIFLNEIGFSDQLFVREQNDLIQQDFAKIVVVNQFYFTNFEKKLLQILRDKTTILSQIPVECFQENTLTISADFSAGHIKPFLSQKIKVCTAADPTGMIAQLAVELANVEMAEIIDFQFERQPYAHLLSGEIFTKPDYLIFSRTRFYRFWQQISGLLNSRVHDGQPFLLSISSLLDLFSADDLLAYFLPEQSERENLRSWLFMIIDNDFQYLDLEFVQQRKNEFAPVFEVIFRFLQEVAKTDSIATLLNLIESNLELEYLLSDLKDKTDLAEVLFAALADFASIETIGLVQNWRKIFPANPAGNLIKLLLDYLKSKKLKLNRQTSPSRFNITSLQDTRNLDFDSLFILNVVEGVLPDRKHTQFLLSENQRKELGLKTYEDITLRDKYYFYRLLCNCRSVTVFTRHNLEDNVEISSFLEELKLHDLLSEELPHRQIKLQQQIFAQLLHPFRQPLPAKQNLPETFFAVPFEKTDFTDAKLSLSFYKWEKLKNDPFGFYLEFLANLQKRRVEISLDFSSKLIGNIAHEIINLVFKRLQEVYQSNRIQHNFIYNTKLYVEQTIEHYLKYNRDFRYISPHNFSDRYFQNIFLPILADGIENFFYRLHNDLHLSEKPISVFPETSGSRENKFCEIGEIQIYLRGRPDLRIQSQSQKFIFDFKTGSLKGDKIKRYSQQLQFYEEIYYLIDQPEIMDEISSYLFFVEQKDLKKLSKRSDLKEEIIKAVERILSDGFGLADKKYAYEELEVTRRDLRKKPEVK